MLPFIFNLMIVNDPTAPSRVLVTADGAVLTDATFNGVTRAGIAVPIDLSVSGPGGLDVGPPLPNAAYNLFLIDDGSGPQGLASLSLKPALPPGFTYAVRLANWPTGNAGNWFKMVTRGKRTHSLTRMSGFEGRFAWTQVCGDYATQTFKAVKLTGIPETAQMACGHMLVAANGTLELAAVDPNNSANKNAIAFYQGGPNDVLSARLYWDYPLAVPQTLNFINSYAGCGISITGWIDSTNAT